jgi:hypothetical protein
MSWSKLGTLTAIVYVAALLRTTPLENSGPRHSFPSEPRRSVRDDSSWRDTLVILASSQQSFYVAVVRGTG